jgi:hypothetical protein
MKRTLFLVILGLIIHYTHAQSEEVTFEKFALKGEGGCAFFIGAYKNEVSILVSGKLGDYDTKYYILAYNITNGKIDRKIAIDAFAIKNAFIGAGKYHVNYVNRAAFHKKKTISLYNASEDRGSPTDVYISPERKFITEVEEEEIDDGKKFKRTVTIYNQLNDETKIWTYESSNYITDGKVVYSNRVTDQGNFYSVYKGKDGNVAIDFLSFNNYNNGKVQQRVFEVEEDIQKANITQSQGVDMLYYTRSGSSIAECYFLKSGSCVAQDSFEVSTTDLVGENGETNYYINSIGFDVNNRVVAECIREDADEKKHYRLVCLNDSLNRVYNAKLTTKYFYTIEYQPYKANCKVVNPAQLQLFYDDPKGVRCFYNSEGQEKGGSDDEPVDRVVMNLMGGDGVLKSKKICKANEYVCHTSRIDGKYYLLIYQPEDKTYTIKVY